MVKKCSGCNKEKLSGEFYKNRSHKDGLCHRCKKCVAAYYKERRANNPAVREREQAACKKHHKEHRDERRAYVFRTRYSLTADQHRAIYVAQNGCCAICGKPVEYNRMCTDHDHVTGTVRGLLCNRCNTLIAIFDDYDLWDRALDYISRKGS